MSVSFIGRGRLFGRRSLHEELGELRTAPLGVEAQQEAVLVDLADRAVRVLIRALPDGDRGVAIDRVRLVCRAPALWLVSVGKPVVDDRGAALDPVIPRVVAVPGVL